MENPARPDILELGDWEIDRYSRRLRIGTRHIRLTRIEIDLLWTLGSHPDGPCTRDMLIMQAWGTTVHVESRTVDVHIGKLRRKLKRLSRRLYHLETVRGVGYRL